MKIEVGNELLITEEFRQNHRQHQAQENVDAHWPLGAIANVSRLWPNGAIDIQIPVSDVYTSTIMNPYERGIVERMRNARINQVTE